MLSIKLISHTKKGEKRIGIKCEVGGEMPAFACVCACEYTQINTHKFNLNFHT